MSETDMADESPSESGGSSIVSHVPGMKPGKTIRNVLIGIGYIATIWIWVVLLPFIAGVFVWRNWFGWATALDRLPGIRAGGGFLPGLSAFIYVLVIVAMIGAAIGDTPPEDAVPVPGESPPASTEAPELITKAPEAMLPTIDDFESGWKQTTANRENETKFYNVETDTLVVFDVAVSESVDGAEQAYANRKQKVRQGGLSSESVSVGNEGFLYKFDRTYLIVNFRVKNVVGRVIFDGPNVATPETNTVRFARLLEETVNE